MEVEDQLYGLQSILAARHSAEQFSDSLRLAAYLLTTVRNSGNLQYVILSLGNAGGPWSEDNLIELIQSIGSATFRKARITEPTITFTEWCDIVMSAAYECDLNFALAVISGILAGSRPKPSRVAITACLDLLKHSLQSPSKFNITCLSQLLSAYDGKRCSKLPHTAITKYCTERLYSTQAKPFTTLWADELRQLSKILSTSLSYVPELVLHQYFEQVQLFGRHTGSPRPSVPAAYFKSLFFGLSVQLQGVASQILHNRAVNTVKLAQSTVLSYEYLGIEVDTLGDNFPPFELVWNLAFDVLLELGSSSDADHLINAGGSALEDSRPKLTETMSRQLFWMLVSKLIIAKLSRNTLEFHLLGAVQDQVKGLTLTDGPNRALEQSVFEASHEVMLNILKRTALANPCLGVKICCEHTRLLLDQFPASLKWKQVSIAWINTVESLGRCSVDSSAEAESLLGSLVDQILSGQIVILDDNSKTSEEKEEDTIVSPPTLRTAHYYLLLQSLGILSSPEIFSSRLDMAEIALRGILRGSCTTAEAHFARDQTFNWIQSLGLAYSDAGVRFWKLAIPRI